MVCHPFKDEDEDHPEDESLLDALKIFFLAIQYLLWRRLEI